MQKAAVNFLLSGLLFLCGCAATTWQLKVPLVSENHLVVEIEQLRRGGAVVDAGYAHPARLPVADLQKFFASLKYRSEGLLTTRELPVFSSDLVPAFAQAVAEGLARCGPSERIRFKMSNPHTELKFIPITRVSRGVVFVKPAGVLNVAFDLVDDTPESDRREELFRTEWDDPTRHTVSTCMLILPPAARLHRDPKGRTHRLWLEVPFENLAGGKPQEPETKPPQEAPSEKQPQKPKLSDEERMHRLKYLRELLDKKIITEEQYKRERKKIFEGY